MKDDFNLDLESTGAEETELADQSEEVVGAEETELADQSTAESTEEGKTSQDSAFAEMRRQNEELQRQLAEAQRGNSELEESMRLFFDGEDADSLNQNARAYAEAMRMAEEEERDITPEDLENAQAYLEAQRELENLRAENDRLKNEANTIELEKAMNESLRELQELSGGEIKSFDDVSDSFLNYISAGLPTKQAYYAAKAEEFDSKVVPPTGMGKIGASKVESEFYTSEEIDKMSREDIRKNYDKVMRSMAHLER